MAEKIHPATATEEDLKRLGLVLLNSVARDVRHIEISGYTYISFKVS